MKCAGLILFALNFAIMHSVDIVQTWNVTEELVNTDGKPKLVPVVNGQYPGPTLRANVGDKVSIRVNNKLTEEGTSIHWHGVRQTNTSWADGTPWVTQCDIPPGGTFLYEFTLDRSGTIWWHSHTKLQKSSLQGLIIVDGDGDALNCVYKHPNGTCHSLRQDSDIRLILSDWYHTPSSEMYDDEKYKYVGDPDTILIDGRGQYCGGKEKTCSPSQVDPEPRFIDVEEDTVYRLRIVGGASATYLNLGIEAHNLTIVEAETSLLNPFVVNYLDVGHGLSYSALLKTYSRSQLGSGHSGLFWIQVNVRHECDEKTGIPNPASRGFAILRYRFAAKDPKLRPTTPVPTDAPKCDDVAWSLAQARSFQSSKQAQIPSASKKIFLLGTKNNIEGKSRVTGWAMNGVSFVFSSSSLQEAVYNQTEDTKEWVSAIAPGIPMDKALEPASLPKVATQGTNVIYLDEGDVVDVILQNTVNLRGKSEIHPWHLHLHEFWVLGYGNFNHPWNNEDMPSNYSTAVYRNSVMVYPMSWTAIRFVANNPGVALFHCHIQAHLLQGMALAFVVGNKSSFPTPPRSMPKCVKQRSVANERRRGVPWYRNTAIIAVIGVIAAVVVLIVLVIVLRKFCWKA